MNDGRKEHDGSESGQSATLKSYESEMIIMSLVQINSQKLTDIAGALRTKLGLGSSKQLSPDMMKLQAGNMHQVGETAVEGQTPTWNDIKCGFLRDDVCPNVIPLNMFMRCQLADEIVIPEKVTSIEGGAFQNTGATIIFVPYGCSVSGDFTFEGVEKVVYANGEGIASGGDWYYDGNHREQQQFGIQSWFQDMLGILYDYEERDPETGDGVQGTAIFEPAWYLWPSEIVAGDLIIPEDSHWNGIDDYGDFYDGTITEIPGSQFLNHEFRRIVIPSSITTIGANAFKAKTGIQFTPRIYVPSTCTTISNSGVYGCEVYTDALTQPAGWNLTGVVDTHYNVSLSDFYAIKRGW